VRGEGGRGSPLLSSRAEPGLSALGGGRGPRAVAEGDRSEAEPVSTRPAKPGTPEALGSKGQGRGVGGEKQKGQSLALAPASSGADLELASVMLEAAASLQPIGGVMVSSSRLWNNPSPERGRGGLLDPERVRHYIRLSE
jgi:hypothetical protein